MSSRPTEAEWHVTLARSMGESKAAAFIAAKKKAHPDRSIHRLSYGPNGISSRNNVSFRQGCITSLHWSVRHLWQQLAVILHCFLIAQ